MDKILLRAFLSQLETQCQFVLLAANDLNRALIVSDLRSVFFALQNLQGAAGNIAKALWGVGGKTPVIDRQELRDLIGVRDDSPLKNVAMRNNYEHFDERLEKWWKEPQRGAFVDLNMMPRSAISGVPEIGWFRNYDAGTRTLTFWGEDFDVQALLVEVNRILPKIQEEVDPLHRLKSRMPEP